MASKSRFSFHWRLFMPLVIGLWVIIFGMAWWQSYREQRMRVDMIYDQLHLIGQYVGNRIQNNADPMPLINFAHNFYDDNTRYENFRISIYNNEGQLVWHKGMPFNLNIKGESNDGTIDGSAVVPPIESKHNFFYSITEASNGKYRILFLLSDNPELTEGSQEMIISFWTVIGMLALFVTVMSYLSTRIVARNIRLLRSFAEDANKNPNFMPTYEFPNDELGEVSRQILELYEGRLKAMERREREHQVAMHAVEEKSLMKRQLTNNINHELKTPIGVIKGYLDTIAETPDISPEMRDHFIEKARQNVERMVSLINDVTAITRLEEGKHNIGTEEVNFHDLVFTHANDIEESGIIGKMQFNFDIPLDCKVVGNQNLLHSMLLNLTKNAVAYSGGTECNLVCSKQDDEMYTFEFYDNGTGVSPEHLPHLFERFYRVTEGRDRRSGGSGLGLPIVYNTVQFLGGSITVENVNPHGLKYTFTLHKSKNSIKQRGPVPPQRENTNDYRSLL